MIPELRTDRLLLRRLRESDADDVFAYASDPAVSVALSWTPHRSPDDSLRFIHAVNGRIAEGGSPLWAAVVDDRVIGTGSFLSIHATHRYADIGYVVGPEHSGRGYAPEIARALVDYGFEAMDLWRIEAQIRITNVRSGRVLEKAGLSEEAVLHGRFFIDGEHHDSRLYAIMREEWERSRSRGV